MAIIKCKMCGGNIEISADKTFGTCGYCGSTMTLPKTDDDQRLSLFNRGTHLRRNGEFDKAASRSTSTRPALYMQRASSPTTRSRPSGRSIWTTAACFCILKHFSNAPQRGANPWGCADYLNQKKAILETGVWVCEWSGEDSMHTKSILIDDRLSLIGSFNWDMRSAYLDTELMLLVDCPALNAALREQTEEMMRQSRLVSPDGTEIAGAAYIAPERSPLKAALQSVIRSLIRPFRFVL